MALSVFLESEDGFEGKQDNKTSMHRLESNRRAWNKPSENMEIVESQKGYCDRAICDCTPPDVRGRVASASLECPWRSVPIGDSLRSGR
jgi:hypothetical protein